jgi:hypothetical protein
LYRFCKKIQLLFDNPVTSLQVEGSGDFPAADFNPDHLLNPAPSGDWLSAGDPPSYGPQRDSEGGGLRRINSWRGIADYYVDGQGQQVEPLPERYVLPQWVKDLRIGPSPSAGGVKPPGVLLKGLGTPMPPSPRSIRAAALGMSDDRSDVISQLLAQTWREGGGANEEGLFGGGSEWDPRRTHGAAARVGGVELQGVEKVDRLKGGGEEPGAANSPLPWVSLKAADSQLSYVLKQQTASAIPLKLLHVSVAAPRRSSVLKKGRTRCFNCL